MSDSDKPEGEIKDSEAVTIDDEGNSELDMERIEMSEGGKDNGSDNSE